MSTNLKFKVDFETDVDSLRSQLLEFSAFAKISALNQIDSDNIHELLDAVKMCAYDYRAAVRTFAYKALHYADHSKITEVLKDGLRDEDSDAFMAARELFETMSRKQTAHKN